MSKEKKEMIDKWPLNTYYFFWKLNEDGTRGFSSIVELPKEGATEEKALEKLVNEPWWRGSKSHDNWICSSTWDMYGDRILHPEATSCSKCENFSRQCLTGSIDDPKYCQNWKRKKIPNEDAIREIIREELSGFTTKLRG